MIPAHFDALVCSLLFNSQLSCYVTFKVNERLLQQQQRARAE